EAQSEDKNDGEATVLAQGTQAVAQIFPEMFDRAGAPRLARALAGLLNAANRDESLAPRFFARHARTDILLRLALDVIAEFFVEFVVERPAAKDGAYPVSEIAEHGPVSLCSFEHLVDNGGQSTPGIGFGLQLLSAPASEFVIAGAAVVLADGPLGTQPAAALQTMQGRIQRALLHLDGIARDLLQTFRNGPAVQRLEGERLQNEQIESSLGQFQASFSHDGLRPSSLMLR